MSGMTALADTAGAGAGVATSVGAGAGISAAGAVGAGAGLELSWATTRLVASDAMRAARASLSFIFSVVLRLTSIITTDRSEIATEI
ncbi:MAG: hypothetical protein EPO07_16385 [Verrucomicrobia bacterium]|nr:MAG: hypothetical protein EPO07_16385 [Verrucomicrobiota bacterium]